MSRSISFILVAIAGLLLGVAETSAQETRLLFTSMSPAGSENSAFFAKWSQRLFDQSKGAVKVDIRDGGTLANFSNVYDRVRDDVVQIGWAIHQVIGGRFPLSEVAGVPFLATGGPEASVALWRLFKTGKLDAEYKDVVPLLYAILPPAYIHFAKPPSSIDSLSGLKVAVSGRLPSGFVTEMGGTPVSMNTGEMYEALQRGTVDAAIISWGGFQPYKLYEVTTYHVEAPLGQATSMFFMTRRKYDALPADVRKVIDANSGEEQSSVFGNYFLQQGLTSRAALANNPRHKIVSLTAEQAAKWDAKAQPLVRQWAKDRADGEAVLDAYRQIYIGLKPK